jgi:hypothetical protein
LACSILDFCNNIVRIADSSRTSGMSEKCHDQTFGGYLTARTWGGTHDPSRIEGAFSFGQ